MRRRLVASDVIIVGERERTIIAPWNIRQGLIEDESSSPIVEGRSIRNHYGLLTTRLIGTGGPIIPSSATTTIDAIPTLPPSPLVSRYISCVSISTKLSPAIGQRSTCMRISPGSVTCSSG